MRLKTAFSADPDDAYAWWGVVSGTVRDSGLEFQFHSHSIASINEACRRGEYDVAAISTASYPSLSRDYVILDAGASVGRGYGPTLVARRGIKAPEALAGLFAVAGASTTGGLLFRLFHGSTRHIQVPWQEIPNAIRNGKVSGGVCIHETLMRADGGGLEKIGCLGSEWTERTGLPIPVGLVVARRSLGQRVISRLDALLRESVRAAAGNRHQAMDYAARFSIGLDRPTMEEYVDMFTNEDTEHLAPDCRAALERLFRMGTAAGLLPTLEIQTIVAAA